jgi:PAS domain S-box-containing protein
MRADGPDPDTDRVPPARLVQLVHERSGSGSAEERYRALILASRSAVWRARADGWVVEAWGWSNVFGDDIADYLGQGWLDALHPDDRAPSAARWAATIASGKSTAFDYRVRQTDGSYRWAISRAAPIRDMRGTITEWVGTVTDIQDQKDSEQALREREELLTLAVEATGLGIWDMELPSRRTLWSPKLKAMAGLRTRPRSRPRSPRQSARSSSSPTTSSIASPASTPARSAGGTSGAASSPTTTASRPAWSAPSRT